MELGRRAFGLAFGLMFGLIILFGTWWLALARSDAYIFSRLATFFPGYSVTAIGSLIGFFWGFIYGFGIGFVLAWFYNAFCRWIYDR
ncbi:MAG: hypothetical protein EHM47_04140 [Ignavibacteriales bacterium]|nr:MAG: hypothetical protein EHM47_04140 [Ignavibacteriales bacterium]